MSKVLFNLTHDDRVANIILNNPIKHNCLDLNVILSLHSCVAQIAKDPKIKVVVLSSNGEHFCSGGDLLWMQNAIKYNSKENFEDVEKLSNLLLSLHGLPQIVICVVQGNVYGGGIGLLACADLVIAADNSIFCFPEVRLGLAPAIISQFIFQSMNISFAKYSMLTAKPFNVEKAHLFGLIHEIISFEKIQQATLDNIENILSLDCNAVMLTKKLLRDTKLNIDVNQLKKCTQLIADLRISKNTQNLIKKFLNRKNTKKV